MNTDKSVGGKRSAGGEAEETAWQELESAH